jgi:hypothetical protein
MSEVYRSWSISRHGTRVRRTQPHLLRDPHATRPDPSWASTLLSTPPIERNNETARRATTPDGPEDFRDDD